MITDGALILCGTVAADNSIAGQLVTAIGNTLSTNTIDLAPNARGGNQVTDYGVGPELKIAVSIMQTLTSAGAATVAFQVVQADNAALSTNLEVVSTSPTFVYSTLTAGTIVTLGLESPEPLAPRRYLGMRIVIGTAVLTNATGQFFSCIPESVYSTGLRYYKSGYSLA